MNFRNLTINEIKDIVVSFGEKPYRGEQIFTWLHKNMVLSLDEMTNVSKNLREKLQNNFEVDFPKIEKEYISKIDDTKKYLIKLKDGYNIESVLMKYKYGYTVCVSSEIGCNMGCKFCASTVKGMIRNLEPYELLAQIYLIEKHNNIKISNIVIMGMGEPLLNFDNVLKFIELINSPYGQNISMRNITISTCGIVENIYKLATYKLPVTLALSLHAPNDKIRQEIMPIAKKYDLHSVMSAMADYYKETNRKITFEYTLIGEINCSKELAYELVKLFDKELRSKNVDFNVNLIQVNEIKESNLKRPSIEKVKSFQNILERAGISVLLRRELGKDISGSCGQLRLSESR